MESKSKLSRPLVAFLKGQHRMERPGDFGIIPLSRRSPVTSVGNRARLCCEYSGVNARVPPRLVDRGRFFLLKNHPGSAVGPELARKQDTGNSKRGLGNSGGASE
jgi:hypothetical protein